VGLTIRLIIQQITFGPSEAYERPPPLTLTPSSPAPTRSRRMSSSFSRISYGVHDDADPEEVKAVLEKNGDGIVGVLFGKSVGAQIGSTWFWYVYLVYVLVERGDTDEKGNGVYGCYPNVRDTPPRRYSLFKVWITG